MASAEQPGGAQDRVNLRGLLGVERMRCGRAMMLVAMMPRLRIAVLKAPTPAEPALVRGSATQTISNSRHSRSCSLRAAAQSPA